MRYVIIRDDRQIPIEVEEREGGYTVDLDGKRYEVDGSKILEGLYSLIIGGESFEVTVHSSKPGNYDVHLYDGMRQVELLSPLEMVLRTEGGKGSAHTKGVKAPMPGKVVKVLVSPGQRVVKGQGVVVVEAMKMQNELRAPREGSVERVGVAVGDTIEVGDLLVVIS